MGSCMHMYESFHPVMALPFTCIPSLNGKLHAESFHPVMALHIREQLAHVVTPSVVYHATLTGEPLS